MYKVHVESPKTEIVALSTQVKGWVASDARPSKIVVHAGERAFSTEVSVRLDVERVFPGKQGTGFKAKLDFRGADLGSSDLAVYLSVDERTQRIATVDQGMLSRLNDAWLAIKASKQARLSGILVCPSCRTTLPALSGSFQCSGCGEQYSATPTLVDVLPVSYREQFRLIETENVSSHAYPRQATDLFEQISKSGGLILRYGSRRPGSHRAFHHLQRDRRIQINGRLGRRSAPALCRRVVRIEVFSSAVLEHVTDPFACAEELMRVLKPSGRIFCSVPFLQPEHGYPHHYYNMTQDGLLNLFTRLGARVEQKGVAGWGHPIYAGQWFLSSYLQHLPPDERRKLNAMTVADFLNLKRTAEEPIVGRLSEKGRRVLAAATYAVFSKD